MTPAHPSRTTSARRPFGVWSAVRLALVCLVALYFAGRDITHPGALSGHGDMARYLMNGVYFHDVIKDAPVFNPVEYTYRYYARYPALSLGHHPPLLSASAAPVFYLLGVSVFAARVTVLLFVLLAVVFMYLLVSDIYDERTAVFATLLMVTTPIVVGLGQSILSEIPTLALIVVSLYWLHRYTVTEWRRHAVLFAVSVVLSLYSKQVAVFMTPVYLLYFAARLGPRKLIGRDALLAAGLIGVLALPLVPMTLKLSQFNVGLATEGGSSVSAPGSTSGPATTTAPQPGGLSSVLGWMRPLRRQMTDPVLLLSLLTIVAAAIRRDARVLLFVSWIVFFYGQITLLAVWNLRLATYWIPAFCLLAAAAMHAGRSRAWRAATVAVLVGTVGYQAVLASREVPICAQGYEEAARHVVEQPKGDTVLFSGIVDTGYFVFFVRQHNPGGRLVVLRADKVLTTSRMRKANLEDRISRPEEVYRVLREFGVGYVVLEDTEYPTGPLAWLSEAVTTDRFTLRRRIPIESQKESLKGVDLLVYEFKEAAPANDAAVLKMSIPLMGDSIQVRLRDLVRGGP